MVILNQKIGSLGLKINSVQLTVSLNPQKLEKIHHLCWEMYKGQMVSVLKLTKLIGLLSSTAQADLQLMQIQALQNRYFYQQNIVLDLRCK